MRFSSVLQLLCVAVFGLVDAGPIHAQWNSIPAALSPVERIPFAPCGPACDPSRSIGKVVTDGHRIFVLTPREIYQFADHRWTLIHACAEQSRMNDLVAGDDRVYAIEDRWTCKPMGESGDSNCGNVYTAMQWDGKKWNDLFELSHYSSSRICAAGSRLFGLDWSNNARKILMAEDGRVTTLYSADEHSGNNTMPDAITADEAGRVWVVLDSHHCDRSLRELVDGTLHPTAPNLTQLHGWWNEVTAANGQVWVSTSADGNFYRWDGTKAVFIGKCPTAGRIDASPAALVAHYPEYRVGDDGHHAMLGVYLHRSGRWEHIDKSESVRLVAIHGTDLVLVRSRLIVDSLDSPITEWWLERYQVEPADARSLVRQTRFSALDAAH